jgi:predicted small secreted protein
MKYIIAINLLILMVLISLILNACETYKSQMYVSNKCESYGYDDYIYSKECSRCENKVPSTTGIGYDIQYTGCITNNVQP